MKIVIGIITVIAVAVLLFTVRIEPSAKNHAGTPEQGYRFVPGKGYERLKDLLHKPKPCIYFCLK